jgi:hypothetical protein
MDAIGWYMAVMHQVLGHDKAAQVFGVPAGDKTACLICRYEADPTDLNRAVVEAALSPAPPDAEDVPTGGKL